MNDPSPKFFANVDLTSGKAYYVVNKALREAAESWRSLALQQARTPGDTSASRNSRIYALIADGIADDIKRQLDESPGGLDMSSDYF